MGQTETNKTCSIICWGVSIVIGLIIFFMMTSSIGFVLALIFAVISVLVLATLLIKVFCSREAEPVAVQKDAVTAPAPQAVQPLTTVPDPGTTEAAPLTSSEEDTEAAASVTAEDGSEAGPEILSGARDGGADDLKKIKGVGPGLEKTLNELGFYHFDQIAGWSDADVEWVDSRLKFKGRITRDDWIAQAKDLAQR